MGPGFEPPWGLRTPHYSPWYPSSNLKEVNPGGCKSVRGFVTPAPPLWEGGGELLSFWGNGSRWTFAGDAEDEASVLLQPFLLSSKPPRAPNCTGSSMNNARQPKEYTHRIPYSNPPSYPPQPRVIFLPNRPIPPSQHLLHTPRILLPLLKPLRQRPLHIRNMQHLGIHLRLQPLLRQLRPRPRPPNHIPSPLHPPLHRRLNLLPKILHPLPQVLHPLPNLPPNPPRHNPHLPPRLRRRLDRLPLPPRPVARLRPAHGAFDLGVPPVFGGFDDGFGVVGVVLCGKGWEGVAPDGGEGVARDEVELGGLGAEVVGLGAAGVGVRGEGEVGYA